MKQCERYGKENEMRKVKYFTANSGFELEDKINHFGKSHKIVQISYSKGGSVHFCLVLYEE